MDEHEKHQQRLNQAAEQFADALVEQLRTVSNRALGPQEQGVKLTQNFFNRVVENLRTQAQNNREMTQQLVDHQQRGAEAAQRLTQETVEAYTSLVNSMLSSAFQQGGMQVTQSATTEAVEEPPGVEVSATEDEEAPPPGEDMRSIIRESVSRSEAGSRQEEEPQAGTSAPEQSRRRAGDEELEQLRRYEAANKNRSTLLRRLDERL